MNHSILISIVMPAYQAEKTLEASVLSVQKQTYENWELLLIDDCSKDTTWELALRLAKQDPRIRPFRNTRNMGVSAARNQGIHQANGEWIAFLDSDDLWEKDKLEKQLRLIQLHIDADLVFTGSAFIDKNGNRSAYCLPVPQTIRYRQLLKQNVISCSSVLVKKKWMLRYPMLHDDMHEDFAVWLQILKNGGRAYGVNEPLLIYRLSADSKSGNKKKAARMTYKVYRYMGLNTLQALYFFCWYTGKNLYKYWKIRQFSK